MVKHILSTLQCVRASRHCIVTRPSTCVALPPNRTATTRSQPCAFVRAGSTPELFSPESDLRRWLFPRSLSPSHCSSSKPNCLPLNAAPSKTTPHDQQHGGWQLPASHLDPHQLLSHRGDLNSCAARFASRHSTPSYTWQRPSRLTPYPDDFLLSGG